MALGSSSGPTRWTSAWYSAARSAKRATISPRFEASSLRYARSTGTSSGRSLPDTSRVAYPMRHRIVSLAVATRRHPVTLPPLSEGLLGHGLEVAYGGPTGEPAWKASYRAPAGEGPLAYPRQPLGPLVELGVGEHFSDRLHRDVLWVELLARAAPVLLVPDYPAAEVDQDLGDVDLDRTHLVASAAERRGVGQRVRAGVADPDELGRQNGADRTRVDRVVGVAAGPLVDGADVQASRATDAVQ